MRSIHSPSPRPYSRAALRTFLSIALIPALATIGIHAALAGSSNQPLSQTVTVDTPADTARGHELIIPAGWQAKREADKLTLIAPEGDSFLILFDARSADADDAVQEAWAAIGRKPAPKLLKSADRPAAEGWDAKKAYRFEVPVDRHRVLQAYAMRHNGLWTVLILDASEAVMDKRDGQIELFFGKLKRQGYQAETLQGRKALDLDDARIQALTRFMEAARQRFDVPGMALGVVQGDRVRLAEGFGLRRLGSAEKVDAQTRFMIASNTKPLTTLMLAKLVEADRFTWDTPVTEVMPSFRVGDADTTQRLRMRHLACACTGMPRRDVDLYFEGEKHTPSSVLQVLADMQPTSGFGEVYQYSNLMVGAAGFIGGRALHPTREPGAAYDAAMQSLVFDPLGMTSTTFDADKAQRGNHASPHAPDLEGRSVVAPMDLNDIGRASRPDGGAWSNVHDLLRYVRMELREGLLPDGSRYIASAPLLERRKPQVSRGAAEAYGIGLKTDASSGALMIHHGGTATGYISDVIWWPEHDVGAVILTNAEGGGTMLRNVFRRRLLELMFDTEPKTEALVDDFVKRYAEEQAAERAELGWPAESTIQRGLANRYRHPSLGEIRVRRRGDNVEFDTGAWRSLMASKRKKDGTPMLVAVAPGLKGWMEFESVTRDGRQALVIRDGQAEYVFQALR